MDSMWDLFRALPPDVKDSVSLPKRARYERFPLTPREKAKFEASSSTATSKDVPHQPMRRQINDHVYEVCGPPAGKRPSVEMIFFHGLQLEGSHEAHLKTWLSADESELWLDWILQDIPDARILTIFYDAHTKKAPKQGIMDMYVTTENLLQCLIGGEARVGQDGCPVVMVGHSIGGLVMKQLCVDAAEKLGRKSKKPDDRMQTFLNNIKGLFFYATPNHGTRLADLTKEKGALFQDVTTLNTKASRQNSDFSELRQDKGWRTFGIGEAHEVTLGSFRGLVVPEASARCDVDGFYTVRADHFNVCRPESKTSSNFSLLLNFILGVVKQDHRRQAPKIALKEAVGVEEQVKDVRQILEKKKRVGIVGIGGIGKTTLAQSVYDTISGSFEYTCFLKTVKLEFPNKRADKLELQDKIVGNLFQKEHKVNKQGFDWGRLKGKKVLLLLDDVEHESQVMVMTEEDGFSDDSRVIVTSRNRGFLRREGFEFFSVKCLNREDSKSLFCFHAFNQTTPANGYDDRVAKFTKKCGGLPLALKVAGRFVYNRSPKLWDDAFLMLESGDPLDGDPDNELSSILSASFNSLANQEREMFLDIAKCFHGEMLDEVKEVWKTYGWRADVGWTNLLEKGLVTETDGWYGKHIEMHEMLRDMGRRIACPQPRNIPGHSRMSRNSRGNEAVTWPFSNEENPKADVEFLKIDLDLIERPVSWNVIDELRKLKKLRVVWFSGGSLHGDCHLFPKELVHVRIEYLASWNDSTDVGTPRAGHRNEDKIVEEQNWTLLYLKLKACRLRTLPGSLGQLRVLQSLIIEGCDRLETLPPCTSQLDALEYLTIQRCSKLSLPDTPWQLKSLKHLVIVDYKSLGILGDVVGQMRYLEHLEIRRTYTWSIQTVEAEDELRPNTLGQLEALKHLHLETGHFAKDFQESLMKLRHLEYLFLGISREDVRKDAIQRSDWLPSLPNNLGELQALKSLTLSNFFDLEGLPNSLGQLKALENLHILIDGHIKYDQKYGFKYGNNLSLPSTIGGLSALQRLVVQGLSVFPEGLCELQGLEYLDIECYKTSLLPENFGHLQGLKGLRLSCRELKALPNSIGELKALENLELDSCSELETLPDTIGKLRVLKNFEVSFGRQLKFLPNTIGELRALETLRLDSCRSLEALPDTLGLLPALRSLILDDCDKISALPHSLGHLQSLRILDIEYCKRLKTITDIILKLKYLERLTIRGCPSLEQVPQSFYDSRKEFSGSY